MLRDLTARTTLVATLYQSTHDARASCADHARIVAAIERGAFDHAAALMLEHIGNVEDALGHQPAPRPTRTRSCAPRWRRCASGAEPPSLPW